MSIQVDPISHVIYVPKADLSLISGSLYELSMNTFRMWLKDWEDDGDVYSGGISFLKTQTLKILFKRC